jgi:hypothetical protein
LIPKLETSNEEEDKGHTNGVGSSRTIIKEEELANLRGGRDSSQRQIGGMKNASN